MRTPGRVKVAEAMRSAGAIHSHAIRKNGWSGNPSERIRELRRRGFEIEDRPDFRDGLNGELYILRHDPGHRAEWLTQGQLDAGLGAATPSNGTPPGGAEPNADLVLARDYTNPDGEWELRAA